MEIKFGNSARDKTWREVGVDDLKARGENALATGPFGSSVRSQFFQPDGVPMIRGSNLADDARTHLIEEGFVYLSEAKAAEFGRSTVTRGDLIFTCWGTINQVGLVSERAAYPRYVISNKQMKLTPDRLKADSLFLFYLFSDTLLQRQIQNQSIGTSVPGFNLGRLRALRFRVPLLPEQRAIAEALSEVDGLLSGLDRLIAKKRDLKQAAMQQLLTSRTRLPGFCSEWKVRRLGSVFEILTGRPKSAHITEGGDFVVCDMGSVSADGRLILSKRTNLREDFLRKGDLVMPKDDIGGGKIIGRVGYVDASDAYVLGDHVYCLRALEGEPVFLAYVINSHSINSALRKKVIGSAQLGLGRGSVEDQEILFPEPAEQTAIAAMLSEMDAELAALERQREKTRALKQAMMQELLTGRTRLI